MRPKKMTPAHHSENFAELVCSNSLRADGMTNAVGVLKCEMEMLDSIVIKYARLHQVPAGGALAVDRENFSKAITEFIKNHPLIEVINEEVEKFPEGYTIIASGPVSYTHLNYLVAFKDHQNINLVEKYVGSFVYGLKDNALLDEDEYFYDDLIGLMVKCDDKVIGKVKTIYNNGRHDILNVDYNGKNVAIPYVDAFIKDVDLNNEIIEVELIKGLIDED